MRSRKLLLTGVVLCATVAGCPKPYEVDDTLTLGENTTHVYDDKLPPMRADKGFGASFTVQGEGALDPEDITVNVDLYCWDTKVETATVTMTSAGLQKLTGTFSREKADACIDSSGQLSPVKMVIVAIRNVPAGSMSIIYHAYGQTWATPTP